MSEASTNGSATPRVGTAGRTGIILAAAILAGTLNNLVGPRRIPWVKDWTNQLEVTVREAGLRVVTLAETQTLVREGRVTLFDARPLPDYEKGALPGALPFPEGDADTWLPQYMPSLLPEDPILIYCSGQDCDESLRLGIYLRDHGITNLMVFLGGYGAWTAAQNSGGTTP